MVFVDGWLQSLWVSGVVLENFGMVEMGLFAACTGHAEFHMFDTLRVAFSLGVAKGFHRFNC